MDELFISIDIEADGRVPGLSSMLSVGCIAIDTDKKIHGSFTCNFDLLEGAKPHPEVEAFWQQNQAAYNATREATVDPAHATGMLVTWLKHTCGDRLPVFLGYPACYDYKWLDYYTERFCDGNPFGHSRCFDIKSYAWAKIGGKFIHANKRNFPKQWREPIKHTHIALDDAKEQAALGINMIRHVQGLPLIVGFA